MYCLVRAIWRNSLVTADVAASSTFDSRLISVESTSISSSERLLKIFADTSAPRLASRIAAFLVPLTDSISAAIASRSRRRQRALLQHPGADELRRHFGLGLRQPQRLLGMSSRSRTSSVIPASAVSTVTPSLAAASRSAGMAA